MQPSCTKAVKLKQTKILAKFLTKETELSFWVKIDQIFQILVAANFPSVCHQPGIWSQWGGRILIQSIGEFIALWKNGENYWRTWNLQLSMGIVWALSGPTVIAYSLWICIEGTSKLIRKSSKLWININFKDWWFWLNLNKLANYLRKPSIACLKHTSLLKQW